MLIRRILITLLALAPLSAMAQDVTLPCPGGMVDSTAAIQAGLWDTRDGGTLTLGACTYYVSQALEARWNHHGAIRGQGQDLTKIEILPGSKIDGVPITTEGGAPLATIFLFEIPEHGDITMTDLSIVVTDPEPAGPQAFQDFFRHALWNLVAIAGHNVDARFERVGFHGAPGNLDGFNAAHGLQMFDYPMVNGRLTVMESDFTGLFIGINPAFLDFGEVAIRDNFIGNAVIGAVLDNCVGCTVNIRDNTLEDVYGVGLLLPQWGPPISSDYFIRNNTMRVAGDGAGAIVLDGGPMNAFVSLNKIEARTIWSNAVAIWGPDVQAVVTQNRISVDSPFEGVGILGIGSTGALISNNRIDGTGFAGILTFWTNNWTVIGNNLRHFEIVPSWNPGVVGVYNCFGFTVVGGPNHDEVSWWNEPFLPPPDHVMTGVNSMHHKVLGKDVSEAMARKREMRDLYR